MIVYATQVSFILILFLSYLQFPVTESLENLDQNSIVESYVVESNHPYSCPTSNSTHFSISTAAGYKIRFDPLCSIISQIGNYLRFCSDINCQSTYIYGSPYYSGLSESGAYGYNITFDERSSANKNDYAFFSLTGSSLIEGIGNGMYSGVRVNTLQQIGGFKVYIRPIYSTSFQQQQLFAIESPHPYIPFTYSVYIYIPYAVSYIINFDNLSSTQGSDYVFISSSEGSSSGIGNGLYAGNNSSELWKNQAILSMTSFYIRFYCATHNPTSFGFKLFVEPIYDLPTSKQPMVVVESAHPYFAYSYYVTISVANAVGYQITFDNHSVTLENDYVSILDSTGLYGYETSLFSGEEDSSNWKDTTTVPHPYPRVGYSTAVHIPGAIGYVISFDNRSSTNGKDYVFLGVSTATNSIGIGNGMYAGNNMSSDWSHSFSINHTFFYIKLSVDAYSSISNNWGFSMKIIPIYNQPIPLEVPLIIESPHPYLRLSYTTKVEVPNAIGYTFRFDNRSMIHGKDYLFLSISTDYTIGIGNGMYSGAISDCWNEPVSINYTFFYVKLSIDSASSVSDWGFLINITPLFHQPVPVEIPVIIESPHPYIPVSYTVNVAVPNAIGYTIVFDRHFNMHGYDYVYISAANGNGLYSYNNDSFEYDNITTSNSAFTISLQIDYHTTTNGWGFKFLVYPLYSDPIVKESLLVLQSPHPYFLPYVVNSQNIYNLKIAMFNAIGYSISFDNRSSIQPKDYLLFYSGGTWSSSSIGIGNGIYSGDVKSDIWKNNITIYQNSFSIQFAISNSHPSAWGFKLYIIPIYDSFPVVSKFCVESPHPYFSTYSYYRTHIQVPSALGYILEFDNQSSIKMEDNLFISTVLSTGAAGVGNGYYSGNNQSNIWNPFTIYNSSFFIKLTVSSTSSSEWGFKINIIPIYELPYPLDTPIIIDSPHPYYRNSYKTQVNVPGAVAYSILFDERCSISLSTFYIDYMTISTSTTIWGSPYYVGDNSSVIWTTNHSVMIYASWFTVYFAFYSGFSDFGFKIFVTPHFTAPAPSKWILDSPHNCEYWSFYFPINIPGAIGYYVQFDERSNVTPGTTSYSNYVRLCTSSSCNSFYGNPYYAGSSDSGMWDSDYNLTVSSTSLFINYYNSLKHVNDWGFRVYVYPITSDSIPMPSQLIISSPHNYWSMSYGYWIQIPGATSYRARFDSNTNINSNDKLSIYHNGLGNTWGQPVYAGPSLVNNTMVFKPFNINAEAFYVAFSGSSNSYWGYKLYVDVLNEPPDALSCLKGSIPANDSDSCLCTIGHSYSTTSNFATLIHRYSFNNGTANDSIGDIDGNFLNGARALDGYADFSSFYIYSYANIGVSFPHNMVQQVEDQVTFEVWASFGKAENQFIFSFQNSTISSFNFWCMGYNLSLSFYNNDPHGYNSQVYWYGNDSYCKYGSNLLHIALTISESLYSTNPITQYKGMYTIFVNGSYLHHAEYTAHTGILSVLNGHGYLGNANINNYYESFNQITVDEYRIWKGALSSEEIKISYANGVSFPHNMVQQVEDQVTFEVWASFGKAENQFIFSFQNSTISSFNFWCMGYNLSLSFYNNDPHGYNSQVYWYGNDSYCKYGSNLLHIALTISESLYSTNPITQYKGMYTIFVNGSYLHHAEYTAHTGILSVLNGHGYLGNANINNYYESFNQITVDEYRIWKGALSSEEIKISYANGPNRRPCFSCSTGYYSNVLGNESCAACPMNTFTSSLGSSSCDPCPPYSSTVQEGSSICLCDIGYYMNAQLGVCIACKSGSVTAAIGSISSTDCVNLVSSFAFGLILLPVSLMIFLIYVVGGRIHTIAIVRNSYIVRLITSASATVIESVERWKVDQAMERRRNRKPRDLLSFMRTWFCIMLMVMVTAFVSMINFAASIGRIFFSSIIIARAFKNANILSDSEAVLISIKHWIESIAQNFSFLAYYLLSPILELFRLLNNINIDYNVL
eukprot:gene11790-15777_t